LSQSEISPKETEAAQTNFEVLVSSVLKVKISNKKQGVAGANPAKDSLLGYLSAVFEVTPQFQNEVMLQSAFAQSQKVCSELKPN